MSRESWSDLVNWSPRHRAKIDDELRKAGERQTANVNAGRARGTVLEPKKGKHGHPEQDIQKAIVQWADVTRMSTLLTMPDKWPAEVSDSKLGEWLYHIPNGGGRSAAEAGIFKAMGVRKGVFDLHLPIPVYYPGWHDVRAGLYFEVKSTDGRMSEDQKAFESRMFLVGHTMTHGRSVEQFHQAVREYLHGALPLYLMLEVD